jgi:hypothetical protein
MKCDTLSNRKNKFEPDMTRTRNPQIRSLTPYPLGYRCSLVMINKMKGGAHHHNFQSMIQYVLYTIDYPNFKVEIFFTKNVVILKTLDDAVFTIFSVMNHRG